jgi:hypothetical protein
LAGDFVSAIVQDHQGNMWFGTVYNGLSRFDGSSWTSYSVADGLVFHVVDALAMDLEGRLWIGTWQGYSIYPRDDRATSVAGARPAARPYEVDLTQNYPNPFNAETIIGYSVSTPGRVSIGILDVLGREVEELVRDQHRQAGSYSIGWRNEDAASGLYFARLQAEGQVKTIRMIKLK